MNSLAAPKCFHLQECWVKVTPLGFTKPGLVHGQLKPWAGSCKRDQPGFGYYPWLFWCWCERTASRNSHSWKLLTQILHIHLHSFVIEIRFLEATGWVLLYIYHASHEEKIEKLPTVISYNVINVYLQKWKCDMNPMKTVNLLQAGV